MFNTVPSAYARTEMDYRANRIKTGFGRRRHHTRTVRRPAEGTESAR